MTDSRTPHKAALADALLLIESLELPYLEALQNLLAEHIATRRQNALTDARAKVTQIAQQVGMSLEELMKEPPKARKLPGPRAPKPPRYRDPVSGKTWNGNGPAPKWMKDADWNAYRIADA